MSGWVSGAWACSQLYFRFAVILGKSLNFSELQLPHIWHKGLF